MDNTNKSSKEKILEKLNNVSIDREKLYEGVQAFTTESIYTKNELSLVENLEAELGIISGKFFRVNSVSDVSRKIAEIAEMYGIKSFYTPENELMLEIRKEGLNVVNELTDPNAIDASITYCECIAARTASIAVSASQNKNRRAHAFAPWHIVVATSNQVKFDVEECMNFLAEKYNGSFPSALTFISGPSRTADIEKTLILGAHGPKELILILADN